MITTKTRSNEIGFLKIKVEHKRTETGFAVFNKERVVYLRNFVAEVEKYELNKIGIETVEYFQIEWIGLKSNILIMINDEIVFVNERAKGRNFEKLNWYAIECLFGSNNSWNE